MIDPDCSSPKGARGARAANQPQYEWEDPAAQFGVQHAHFMNRQVVAPPATTLPHHHANTATPPRYNTAAPRKS